MTQIAQWTVLILNSWVMMVLAITASINSGIIYHRWDRSFWRLTITATFILFSIFYAGRATGWLSDPLGVMMARITVCTFLLNAIANQRNIFLGNRHGKLS